MPRNPKVFINNTMTFLTTSVEEGIMFPPNPLINELMLSAMAKAQAHFPLEICDYILSTTHIHFLVRVTDPSYVPGFMGRFKTESAHSINQLLGRKKRTLWCEGYDSPLLPTVGDVIKKKVYLYTNPAKDGIFPTIESYPGLSSWAAFRQGKRNTRAYNTTRNNYWELPNRNLKIDNYRAFARKLTHKKEKIQLKLYPDSWMKCFSVEEDRESLNGEIVDRIKEQEKEFELFRKQENGKCIPFQKLINTPIGKPYEPDRTGKRMLVHCHDKEIRKSIICWMKNIIAKGREVFSRWQLGDITTLYPAGIYPPSFPKQAEIWIDQLA